MTVNAEASAVVLGYGISLCEHIMPNKTSDILSRQVPSSPYRPSTGNTRTEVVERLLQQVSTAVYLRIKFHTTVAEQ